MSWARMDDSFHDHPKVVGLPLAAVGLWTLCLSWAHRHARKAATKGAVSRAVVYRLGGSDEIAALLVDAELWELADDGWVIHDFEDYLRADDPAVKAQAGRRGAAARWQTDGKPMADHMADLSQTDGEPVADAKQTDGSRASARAFPTRPEVLPAPNGAGAETDKPTLNQRAETITRAYTGRVRLSNHAAVKGIVGKAMRSGDWSDEEITAALARLADDGRSVTADSLRYELAGRPPPNARAPNGRPTTDDKIRNTLALGAALNERQRKELAP